MSEIRIDREYWINGNIKSETPRQNNNQWHGLASWWYENGALRAKELYKNGKFDGDGKYWYDNGQLRSELLFGQSYQSEKNWHEDGQLYSERYWLYGEQVTRKEYRKHELTKQLSGI